MKKAVSKKSPGKKPEVKQPEKSHWELLDSDNEYCDGWSNATSDEALKHAAKYIEDYGGSDNDFILCKSVPTYSINIVPPSKPLTTGTCLATGETTTITL